MPASRRPLAYACFESQMTTRSLRPPTRRRTYPRIAPHRAASGAVSESNAMADPATTSGPRCGP